LQEVRIGIVGIMGRGSLAFQVHQPELGVRVAAAVDSDESLLSFARATYGQEIAISTNFGDLLDAGLHGVIIASRDDEHETQIIQALEHGLAVLCNPPFALSAAGCDRVLATAARTGAPLYSFNSLRYAGFMQEMARLVSEGAIGTVKSVSCRHFIAYGGDAFFKDWHAERQFVNSHLLHAGFQDFDALQWLAGAAPAQVQAMGSLSVYGALSHRDAETTPDVRPDSRHWPPQAQRDLNPAMDVEDLSLVSMAMSNGVLCHYQQCHFAPDTWRSYTILGDSGRIENLGNAPGFSSLCVWNKRHDYHNPEGDARYEIPASSGIPGGPDEDAPDLGVLNAFVERTRRGHALGSAALEARNAMVAACLATESLRNGGQAQLMPPLPPDLAAAFPESALPRPAS